MELQRFHLIKSLKRIPGHSGFVILQAEMVFKMTPQAAWFRAVRLPFSFGEQGVKMLESPRVGVGVIIIRDEQVLLLKRKNVHGVGS